MSRRTIFYIDGYNLYCGLKEKGFYKHIWLDLFKLCETLKKAKSDNITRIKYFTTVPTHKPDKAARHLVYIDALSSLSSSIDIIYGRFKNESTFCKICGRVFRQKKEKLTDVAIATHLLQDYFMNAPIL